MPKFVKNGINAKGSYSASEGGVTPPFIETLSKRGRNTEALGGLPAHSVSLQLDLFCNGFSVPQRSTTFHNVPRRRRGLLFNS